MPLPNIESVDRQSGLSVERIGSGPPLLFLHGWGMSRSFFRPLAHAVAAQHSSWLLALPGYGQSAPLLNGEQIDVYTDHIVRQLALTSPVDWCGWSIGSLVALNIAYRYPQCVRRLVLFTATPCFQSRAHWMYGIGQDVLNQFAGDLAGDYAQTLSRFLTLQYKNVPRSRDQLREVKGLLAAEPKPTATVLQQGLQLLQTTDLLAGLPYITCPTLIINGDRDSLIPTPAARHLAEHMPNTRAVLVHGAGHLPFMTHTRQCVQQLQDFFHE